MSVNVSQLGGHPPIPPPVRESFYSEKEEEGIDELTSRFSEMTLQEEKESANEAVGETRKAIRPLKIIRNAHDDDIHGFVSTAPGFFVSGSKDNSLKMWTINGDFVQHLETEASKRGYKYWVTALSAFSKGLWASGTRDGQITIWDVEGNVQSTLRYNPSRGAKNRYQCKERNKTRINCITELDASEESVTFYTGTPKYIQLWDGLSGKFLRGYKASENDWVYCIEVLEKQHLLVVIGSDLEYWKMHSFHPKKQSLIQESRHRAHRQRPHISAIKRLEHDRNQLASALFDGSVKLIDIIAQRLLRDYREHRGRVWSVENVRPQLFASSADDKTIKIWDVRQHQSVLSIGKNPGRVSSLLRLSDTSLISGSCPDDVMASQEKASMTFWDIRQIV